MYLPSDPAMLCSIVNMRLRDQYATLDELCDSEDVDIDELKERLASAGYAFDDEHQTFKSL